MCYLTIEQLKNCSVYMVVVLLNVLNTRMIFKNAEDPF